MAGGLKDNTPETFGRVYGTGGHSKVVARRLASAQRLKYGSAQAVMKAIACDVDNDTVVFGFGNFVGMGCRLTEYWNAEGVAYGI